MTLIAQISDLHLRPRGATCFRVSDTNMFAERTVLALKNLPQVPDAVVVTGDLTDGNDPREYDLAREILGRLSMPVYVIPGNHDGSFALAQAMKGYPGIKAVNEGSKLHYTAKIGELQLIALDSSIPGKPYGQIGEDQLLWLEAALSANIAPTLIAVHHPPIQTGMRFMDSIGLKDADALATVVERHAHVKRIMCGHAHRAITAEFAGTVVTLAPSTAHNSALDFSENAPAHFRLEPAQFYLHVTTPDGSIATHSAFVEQAPGPFSFVADEGVSWP